MFNPPFAIRFLFRRWIEKIGPERVGERLADVLREQAQFPEQLRTGRAEAAKRAAEDQPLRLGIVDLGAEIEIAQRGERPLRPRVQDGVQRPL